ncbi:carboxylesterase/lipase family protein [Pseudorhodobacter sp. MZDSW-24AT]|uniref:carboxylesterase/lipase family protein n=1 Tax=Pseudorhodobacter sp. MZDSW-24AT TaxID=2052957 RepID=UPI000C1E7F01|nr:carboxylesterase family protein [Pseudorhodobacter sp. MZDSW-24AT]PJF08446.1 hypothetical protein CUR21_13540 [Pseudorhodobacter sp. MZDSW-24AT]
MQPEADPLAFVQTEEGTLAGRLRGGVRSFLGIPYAAPPVGLLRFRPPEPPAAWSGLRRATGFAAAAPQPADAGFFPGDPDAMPVCPQSEDCLYLNVWAPEAEGPHPVLVWFHGGSQIIGGTARPVYDGAAFAKAGIVCVTVGFRLGALGYLALGDQLGSDYAQSGHSALLDQMMALRWVQRNVAAFGGDPARVTLGGESAGAKNIAALMAAPTAKGLFRAAILQSGGGDSVHTPEEAERVAHRFLALAGVSAARELLHLPVAALLAVQARLLAEGGRRFPFRPVIGTPVLPLHPVAGIRQDLGGRHALLIGTTRDEYAPHLAIAAEAAGWPAETLAHFTPARLAAIAEKAAQLWPELPRAALRARLLAAEGYHVPSARLAEAHAAKGAATWVYRFDLPLPQGPLAGRVLHTADLSPTWAQRSRYDSLPGRPADGMHRLVSAFVQSGQVDWPAYTPTGRLTALIGHRVALASDPGGALHRLFGDPDLAAAVGL